MNYALNNPAGKVQSTKAPIAALRKLWPIVASEKKELVLASIAILVNSLLTLIAPVIIGHVIDTYIAVGLYGGVVRFSIILFVVYVFAFISNYVQMRLMGGVGQRVLFNLRNTIFLKLQSLPVAFFNQNKSGDLISRINNDTDKLNQFFSQSLMQLVGNIFIMAGAAVFILFLNIRLGTTALLPAVGLLIFTQATGAWIKRKNAVNLQSSGGMSAEIQESLDNFKVIVAFNRRDYFRKRFDEANEQNYRTALSAGIVNGIFTPLYGFCTHAAQLLVLIYGISLIASGQFTVGLLIGFLIYVTRFYDPLRQMASIWSSFQIALAAWDRITAILDMESDMLVEPDTTREQSSASLLEFRNVDFGYPEGTLVLRDVSFELEAGKTYALVGPTGGGKTTTASLMARLYDPTNGTVFLSGKNMKSYSPDARAKKIGFILQEPFIFDGTVRDNLLYGNDEYQNKSSEELQKILSDAGLEHLLERFEKGLETPVRGTGDAISLGQRQLIAFMRALLRQPELLILDEATANIDTVTEQLLEDILKKLSKQTTKVIIAHRLNTIENADSIFFVNGGTITAAGSFDHAVDMLLHDKRSS